MARKILLIGSKGQLGSTLQAQLSNQFHVINTVYSTNKTSGSHLLDVTDRENVSKSLELIKPDIIINCATYSDVDKCEVNRDHAHDVNVSGVKNLIKYSRTTALFIYISSDYVFNGESGPYIETDQTFPINYYGKTKLEAENFIRGSRRPYLILRPNVIYSENLFHKSNFFGWVYKSLLNNNSISVVTDQVSNPTFAPHLSDAIFKCIIFNCQGIYHFGSEDYLSRYDFACLIADTFKLNKELIKPIDTEYLMDNVDSYMARRPLNSGLKTNKIENEMDLSIYSTQYNLNLLKKYLHI